MLASRIFSMEFYICGHNNLDNKCIIRVIYLLLEGQERVRVKISISFEVSQTMFLSNMDWLTNHMYKVRPSLLQETSTTQWSSLRCSPPRHFMCNCQVPVSLLLLLIQHKLTEANFSLFTPLSQLRITMYPHIQQLAYCFMIPYLNTHLFYSTANSGGQTPSLLHNVCYRVRIVKAMKVLTAKALSLTTWRKETIILNLQIRKVKAQEGLKVCPRLYSQLSELTMQIKHV